MGVSSLIATQQQGDYYKTDTAAEEEEEKELPHNKDWFFDSRVVTQRFCVCSSAALQQYPTVSVQV